MKLPALKQIVILVAMQMGLFTVAHASTYCVQNGGELKAALVDVSNGGIANGHDNTIRLASGIFAASNASFTFNSSSGYALTIQGGYDATCTVQNPAPGQSRLDGGSTTQTLNVQTNGLVQIRNVTLQHGFNAGSAGAGGQIYLSAAAAQLVFANNQVIDNVDTYSVGGLTIFGMGTAVIHANLFAGNSAPAASALATNLASGGVVYLTNNTITGNTNTATGNTITALGGGSASGYVSNNISFGNGVATDYYLYSYQTFEFRNNLYHAISGVPTDASADNIDVDPKFIGAGNYRLSGLSPALAAGLINPAGGLPATDLDGHAFPAGGRADMGAFQDTIYIDGFDGS
jgi:hypothetical protein